MPISLTTLLATLSSIVRSRASLLLKNLALRQQIGVLQRSARKRPKLTSGCMIFQRLSIVRYPVSLGNASNQIIWCLRSGLLHASRIRSFRSHRINSPETGASVYQNCLSANADTALEALGRRNLRRVRLDPSEDDLRANLWRWRNAAGFVIRYRTRDSEDLESDFRSGRLEPVDQGFYLNLTEIPSKALIEVEGVLDGEVKFGSGWVSADAVQIRIF